jgi:hypothetical protein
LTTAQVCELCHARDLAKSLFEGFDGWFDTFGFLVIRNIVDFSVVEFAYQVIFGVIRAQLLLIILHIVYPFKFGHPFMLLEASEVGEWAHLSIDKGVAENQLFIFEHFIRCLLDDLRRL